MIYPILIIDESNGVGTVDTYNTDIPSESNPILSIEFDTTEEALEYYIILLQTYINQYFLGFDEGITI